MARPENPCNQYTKFALYYKRVDEQFLSALQFLAKHYGNISRAVRNVFGKKTPRAYYSCKNAKYRKSVHIMIYYGVIEHAKKLGWRWEA